MFRTILFTLCLIAVTTAESCDDQSKPSVVQPVITSEVPDGAAVVEHSATPELPCPGEKSTCSQTLGIRLDPSMITTVGNHSYIEFNQSGLPSDFKVLILHAVDEFEKLHPELEVTTWSIEEIPDVYSTSPYIFGIWVNHKPKTPSEPRHS